MDRIEETYRARTLGEEEAARQREREIVKVGLHLFAHEIAQDYLDDLAHRRSFAGWMERNTTTWIPVLLGVGLAIAIVWGVR